MNTVDPSFKKKLQKIGNGNWNECFHCGNCTAICPHTEDGNLFPRKGIRTMQMGLKDKITGNVDPWLCYYCGECSETCPRDANPGELMMLLRRYLTKVYDWTGLTGVFYSSLTALLIAFTLIAIGVVGIAYAKSFDVTAVMEFGHIFEKIAIISVAGVILLPNIIRMFWFTIIREHVNVPLKSYITGMGDFVLHMFTQINTLKCKENFIRWFEHLIIVTGYLLLLFTTVFLNWFSTENIYIIYLGYIVGAIIFIVTFDFILKRIRKKSEISKFSHPTDWFFVIWLFLMGLSAFMVRLFIDANLINNNLWLYLVHLIVLAQWAIVIVPFGKWTHFLYRSFAIYFNSMKKAAMARQLKKEKLLIAT